MKYEFNTIIDRHNTNSIKTDLAVRRGKPEDVLPLWVADMDFTTSPEILESLHKKVNHGIFGYSLADDAFYKAVKNWQKSEHNFDINRHYIVTTPGVVFAVATAIKAFTKKNDSIIIFTPIYYPLRDTIINNERKVITSSLIESNGKYKMDYEDFEKKIIDNKVKLFILCSPHNPVGRVWTKEELLKLSEICLRHNVLVFSDEIHNDFIYEPNRHTVYSTLSEEVAQNCIVSTSASKTFNLAGLQFSINFIQNPNLKQKFKNEIAKTGYDEPSLMGLVATQAAYEKGKPWLIQLKKYLLENLNFLKDFLKKKLPKVRLIEPEGTFLVWLDFSAYGLQDDELDNIIVNKAKLWLDRGTMFGIEGDNFQRINIATPRKILQEALEKLEKIFGEL